MLDAFLDVIPPGARAAFEFRHKSWLSEDVYERLKARNMALCITDSEKATTPLEFTAEYGYLRLRDEGYKETDIVRWGDVIMEHAADLTDVFVYFKHEQEGKGPSSLSPWSGTWSNSKRAAVCPSKAALQRRFKVREWLS